MPSSRDAVPQSLFVVHALFDLESLSALQVVDRNPQIVASVPSMLSEAFSTLKNGCVWQVAPGIFSKQKNPVEPPPKAWSTQS